MEHDIYILTDWSRYHRWEDGRSNYAWDLSVLNENKMTYSNHGSNLSDFASFGLKLHLPLAGRVVNVNKTEKDHDPDLVSAIEFEALNDGTEAHLEEKPNNCVEITPGGPFLFRMLHQKQVRKARFYQIKSQFFFHRIQYQKALKLATIYEANLMLEKLATLEQFTPLIVT